MLNKIEATLTRSYAMIRLARSVIVVGTFRSGTNVIAKVIDDQTSSNALYHAFGWKHGPLSTRGQEPFRGMKPYKLISISKDPFSYVLSLYKYIEHRKRNILTSAHDLNSFIHKPIEIYDQAHGASVHYRFRNPLDYWNFLYGQHLTLPERSFNVQNVRYIDLISKPDDTMQRVSKNLSLRSTVKEFSLPQQPVDAAQEGRATSSLLRGSAFDIGYYMQKRYLEELSSHQIDFISSQVDPWVIERLGYSQDD